MLSHEKTLGQGSALSFNGTVPDLAAFCRVSERTVSQWMRDGDVRYSKIGRNVFFDEEAVLDLYEQHTRISRATLHQASQPGVLREIFRKEWRAHLELLRDSAMREEIAALHHRVTNMEQRLEAEIHHRATETRRAA